LEVVHHRACYVLDEVRVVLEDLAPQLLIPDLAPKQAVDGSSTLARKGPQPLDELRVEPVSFGLGGPLAQRPPIADRLAGPLSQPEHQEELALMSGQVDGLDVETGPGRLPALRPNCEEVSNEDVAICDPEP
jgi:hypothetical protein